MDSTIWHENRGERPRPLLLDFLLVIKSQFGIQDPAAFLMGSRLPRRDDEAAHRLAAFYTQTFLPDILHGEAGVYEAALDIGARMAEAAVRMERESVPAILLDAEDELTTRTKRSKCGSSD